MNAASHHHRHRRHSWQADIFPNVPAAPAVATAPTPALPAAPKPAFPAALVPPVPRARHHHADDGPGLGLAILIVVLVIAGALGFMYWAADDSGPQPTPQAASDFNHAPDFNHPLPQSE